MFTSGTTAALKLIAECFTFELCNDLDGNGNDEESPTKGAFVYTRDNHTSVLGMREIVKTDRINHIERDDLLQEFDKDDNKPRDSPHSNSLLVVAAQCNYNGFKFPLEIIDKVHRNGTKIDRSSKWFVCLDAASFVSTNFLDLTKYEPDFVCCSFYKLFGYPTGLGALLVRKEAEHVIDKRYYGGGTVKIAMSGLNWHRKRDTFHERLEDGTVPFLSIISLLSGFQTIERLVPPGLNNGLNTMQRISKHVFNLAAYAYSTFESMKYEPSGNPVVKLYHDTDFRKTAWSRQGGILNFNVLRDDGSFVGFAEVAYLATVHNIYLRTGCFCNTGACQRHLGLSNDDLRRQYGAGHICGDSNDLVNGVPTGSVRISIGYMTKKSDVEAVIEMIRACYARTANERQKVNQYLSDKVKLSQSITVQLKMICVYPIKSCAPFKITTEWPLSARGLRYDREWMIITETGTSFTQKNSTRLCMIRPEINLADHSMTLQFPRMKTICLRLDDDDKKSSIRKSGMICQSKVCGDRVEGIDCGDTVADWLTEALDCDGLRLIRQEDHRISRQYQNNIALSNQAQFLLINRASTRWLAEKVDDWIVNGVFPESQLESVVDRFRGNLIVEFSRPLEELQWGGVVIGGVQFIAEGPCTRCYMICIDQKTGIKTPEPLQTIAREFGGKMKFGLYLTQICGVDDAHGERILKCGDGEYFSKK